jgi:hypothetical protein
MRARRRDGRRHRRIAGDAPPPCARFSGSPTSHATATQFASEAITTQSLACSLTVQFFSACASAAKLLVAGLQAQSVCSRDGELAAAVHPKSARAGAADSAAAATANAITIAPLVILRCTDPTPCCANAAEASI